EMCIRDRTETARPVISHKCGKLSGNITPTSATIITQPSTIQSPTSSSSIVQVNGINTEISGEAAGEAVGKVNAIGNAIAGEAVGKINQVVTSSQIGKPEGVICKNLSCEIPEEYNAP
ncbi:MAG: hypothetical protein QUS12_04625, partial [Methanosarcina sp.]|nr:hypothetical protein [Methanosarcina sp.]